jgi:hypothetical protein
MRHMKKLKKNAISSDKKSEDLIYFTLQELTLHPKHHYNES